MITDEEMDDILNDAGYTGPSAPGEETPFNAREYIQEHLYEAEDLDRIPDPEWLIEGILSKDALTWLYGKRGEGKSLVALDMAGCIATEAFWQGHRIPTNGSVLYLAAEGARGTRKRVRAWERGSRTHSRTMTGVTFLTVPVSVKNEPAWNAMVDICTERQVALVILDTQARITPGMEENSNKEMGVLVARLDQLRRATGACVLVVHHAGHGGEHARGASALEAAADCVIRVTQPNKESPIIEITSEKQKDAADFPKILLRMVESPDPSGDEALGSVYLSDSECHDESVAEVLRSKWISDWWHSFGTDPVSRSQLIDVTKVHPRTFHRHVNLLVGQHFIAKEGTRNRPLYSLLKDPQFL